MVSTAVRRSTLLPMIGFVLAAKPPNGNQSTRRLHIHVCNACIHSCEIDLTWHRDHNPTESPHLHPHRHHHTYPHAYPNRHHHTHPYAHPNCHRCELPFYVNVARYPPTPSYRQFGRETTFSVDQLLIRNALLASAFEMRCVICCGSVLKPFLPQCANHYFSSSAPCLCVTSDRTIHPCAHLPILTAHVDCWMIRMFAVLVQCSHLPHARAASTGHLLYSKSCTLPGQMKTVSAKRLSRSAPPLSACMMLNGGILPSSPNAHIAARTPPD
jgi:hypothetical protein